MTLIWFVKYVNNFESEKSTACKQIINNIIAFFKFVGTLNRCLGKYNVLEIGTSECMSM